MIPNKDELKCCEDLVEEILKLNKTLETKSSKYINRVKSNLGLDRISNKLNQFYEYDFKTFLSELKKKKIKLSLSDQDEWEDYFDDYTKK
ncbi:hypothetical protein Q2T40_04630 [Winogradskyella maritima]|nr:hypothetical protein [Winogradskyella maritima]